jgi:hypothetical protein
MWLEDNWDHRMLIYIIDPMFFELQKIDSQIVGVPFNPTAENMGLHLLQVVGPTQLKDTGVHLAKVVVEETRKCGATVSE